MVRTKDDLHVSQQSNLLKKVKLKVTAKLHKELQINFSVGLSQAYSLFSYHFIHCCYKNILIIAALRRYLSLTSCI